LQETRTLGVPDIGNKDTGLLHGTCLY
jgi:hypothetical protein